jgi:YVTN family beta-propeller protein
MSPRRSLLLGVAGIWFAAHASEAAVRSSPIAITNDGATIVVVNPDSASVSLIDALSHRLIGEVPLGGTPQTVTTDSARAYVVTREGVAMVIDLSSQRVVARAHLCTECFGVVLLDGQLYVTDSGSSRVVVADANTLQVVSTIATQELPRGLASAGADLYVSHFRSGRVSVIDRGAAQVAHLISTGPDSNISQSLVIDAANHRIYLPQTLSNSSNRNLTFDTTAFPVVSVIDIERNSGLTGERIAMQIADRPVNMPLDAALTRDGILYVVNAGSDDVSVIDLNGHVGVAHIDVGSNPRGVVLSPDEQFAYVNNTLSGTVSVIRTATNHVEAEITHTRIALPPDVLNGKILFHNSSRAALARDHWLSCATCHFDGDHDGRTWFFRDGPRNTPSLFGVGQTLPVHWSGDLNELQDVENSVRVLQGGTGLADGPSNCEPACDKAPPNAGRSKDLDDFAAFMRSLQAPPPPPITDPEAVNRGRVIFFVGGNGCAGCHPAPFFTNRQKHNVSTGNGALERKGLAFDTPSLRGLYDTAPYFHDGSASTLAETITSRTGAHGIVAISERDKNDLVAFMLSIPFSQPRRHAAAP